VRDGDRWSYDVSVVDLKCCDLSVCHLFRRREALWLTWVPSIGFMFWGTRENSAKDIRLRDGPNHWIRKQLAVILLSNDLAVDVYASAPLC